jgi:Ca-activated chloride channel homolog
MTRFATCGHGLSRSPKGARFLAFLRTRSRCGRVAMAMGVRHILLATAICLSLSAGLAAQEGDVHVEPRPTPDPTVKHDLKTPESEAALKAGRLPRIASNVDLVLVPVTVTDDWNRIVTGLDKDNFGVMEDSGQQEVRYFSSEDAPVSLGVIFDMSGSMSDKIEKAREAVIEFFKTANPLDEFFMVTFNDRPELRADFTKSVEDVQGKLVYTIPKGRTALLDAIYMGVNHMKEAHNAKKALLIISDGGDNHSRYTTNEIKAMVKEADVQIYSIGIFTAGASQPEEIAGPQLLGDISSVTGGRLFVISNPNELSDVATKIGIELRNQYVLGYRPANRNKDGKWRKIKVKLTPPKGLPHLNVYSKQGYYAPSQ